ncbi:MAG: glycosyltransferase [Phycisphaerae bacterium]|nr:nucleotide disphospho-sugar-binding domain-containing protein [Tepidisphaeraceae bacterium]
MDFLLTPVGSAGDNFPFIGLGARLAANGHRVAVITNDHFAPLIRACGLEFVSIGTEQEWRDVIADERIWDPRRGFETVMRLVAEQNRRVFDAVEARLAPDTAVVAHTLDFASRAIGEKTGMPVVSVQLQPSIVRTVHQLPTMTGTTNYSFMPRWLKRTVWRLIDRFLLDKHAGPVVNAPRQRLGLPPIKRVFADYIHSPLLSVGLWPEWYAPAQPDYPPQFKLTSFPLFDAFASEQVPPDVDAFLADGPPPVVFTPGSANVHAAEYFAAAARACAIGGHRGMLLTRHAEQVPSDLPPGVRHFPFAPLSRTLGRCAAIAHHGGIGTVAAALAAGVPQLVMPLSHDQPDNAHRVRKLGVGETLFPKKFTPDRAAAALARLLGDPRVKERATAIAQKCAAEDGLGETARLLERATSAQPAPEVTGRT